MEIRILKFIVDLSNCILGPQKLEIQGGVQPQLGVGEKCTKTRE